MQIDADPVPDPAFPDPDFYLMWIWMRIFI